MANTSRFVKSLGYFQLIFYLFFKYYFIFSIFISFFCFHLYVFIFILFLYFGDFFLIMTSVQIGIENILNSS